MKVVRNVSFQRALSKIVHVRIPSTSPKDPMFERHGHRPGGPIDGSPRRQPWVPFSLI